MTTPLLEGAAPPKRRARLDMRRDAEPLFAAAVATVPPPPPPRPCTLQAGPLYALMAAPDAEPLFREEAR